MQRVISGIVIIIMVMFIVPFINCDTARNKPFIKQYDLFVSGKDGYHTFRIPSVIVTSKGTILAFCEGRKQGRSDTGDIDIVLKRSFDNGKTWQPMEIVWDDGSNVCGNPCPVIDRDTGTIWLLLTHNLGEDSEKEIVDGTSIGSRTAWVTKSIDDGATWTEPVEITSTTKKSDWTWYATGPGVGIQLTTGRMVIPCDHIVAGSKVFRAHIIYSDNHGATWEIGGIRGDRTNECQSVELINGKLLLNMRNYSGNHRRAVAISDDKGMTWSDVTYDQTLIEPVCQASLLRFTDTINSDRSRILFSNPASEKREKMTVRLSYDECASWEISKVIHPGPSAYSCLAALNDGTIACLYERGNDHAYETITFTAFNLVWLTDGADRLR